MEVRSEDNWEIWCRCTPFWLQGVFARCHFRNTCVSCEKGLPLDVEGAVVFKNFFNLVCLHRPTTHHYELIACSEACAEKMQLEYGERMKQIGHLGQKNDQSVEEAIRAHNRCLFTCSKCHVECKETDEFVICLWCERTVFCNACDHSHTCIHMHAPRTGDIPCSCFSEYHFKLFHQNGQKKCSMENCDETTLDPSCTGADVFPCTKTNNGRFHAMLKTYCSMKCFIQHNKHMQRTE